MTLTIQSSKRFDYIDALRGFAILGVIFAHSASITQTQGTLRVLADTAGLGVQLFFVISAFTIFHMLTKHSAQENSSIRNFFIRRLFRIVPVYWFGILFYSILFGLSSRGWLPGPEIWHYPFHVSLMNVLHPLTQSSVVPGGWSISCEVLFYLSVPLWFKRIKDIRHAYVFLVVCVFLLPVFTKLLSKIINPHWAAMDPFLLKLYWERFPLVTLGSFSFGICLYYLLKEQNLLNFFRPRLINIVTTIVVCIMLVSLMTVYPRLPIQIHIYGFLFMMLALMLSLRPWVLFVNPLTVLIGRISYSAYLFHFFVLNTLIHCIKAYVPGIISDPISYFLIVFFLSLVLTYPFAWCGYHLIELPAINYSKRIIQRFEDKERELRGGRNLLFLWKLLSNNFGLKI